MLEGFVHPDFGHVAKVFSDQMPGRRAGGGAICIYHQGECVLDIWTGTRNQIGDPWIQDTLALENAVPMHQPGEFHGYHALTYGWLVGYHRAFTIPARMPRGFGHYGYGGSGAWADPDRNLSFGLVVNSGAGTPFGDTRILKLTHAALHCVNKKITMDGDLKN